MADLQLVSLPHMSPAVAMSATPETLTLGSKVSAVYIFIDDPTVAPGVGQASTDGVNYQPILGRCWELIYTRPMSGAPRDATVLIKVSSGTPNRYLRVF